MSSALSRFSAATRTWFEGAFSAPTAAQEGAWNAISAGKHALIVAPTGSGKTLAAFLWALDKLHADGGSQEELDLGGAIGSRRPTSTQSTKILYISPLKALGVDVERNLRAPLIGISQTAKLLGAAPPQVSVGVRSGDTPAKERRQLISHPPDILITTPESLYLMLTSKARSTLSQVHTVIIDEVHAVAGTKRGAHLAVTLERLDQILDSPAQRIGLSATVEPVQTVAHFLGGVAPVDIVQPPSEKTWDLKVSVPVADMTALGGPQESAPAAAKAHYAKYDEQVHAFEAAGSTFDDGLELGDSVQDSAGTGEHSPNQHPHDAPKTQTGLTLAESLGIHPVAGPHKPAPQPASHDSTPPAPNQLPPLQETSNSSTNTPGITATAQTDQEKTHADLGISNFTVEEFDPTEISPAELNTTSTPETSGYQASIWPHVEERIVDLVEENRSTIVFTNSRGLSEKLTARLNEIYSDRLIQRQTAGLPAPAPRTAPSSIDSALTQALEKRGGIDIEKDDARLAPTRPPAQIMASSQTAQGAAPLLARAHHGSVSKDQRSIIEEALKSGSLKCVVATSSLELGIDMGAVDLVIQVESPPSVASGLQRVGRAGHQVGEISRGYLYPKHRGDLLTATVVVQRMLAGDIEPIAIATNPLDILAQQTVAACALGPIEVQTWFEALRHTAPFATLPRSAFEATLDLLAGKYPSDEFAELRPRIVWDRDAGIIEGRPGAQRIAVTSGGTIPDRGLFPVYIVGSEDSKAPKRVGELDEEMVYESRAGDVIALGASSWRIEDISHDRVSVVPAPGMPGKLPFWHGEGPGRPVALGRALGKFTRELAYNLSQHPAKARESLLEIGLDTWAADNTEAYVFEQVQATAVVPSDTQLIVERFKDEIGDWRVILHSPLGMPVHAPWALAVGARAEERYGINASAMAADDGIVLRIPALEAEPPGLDLFLFDTDEIEALVTERLGSSALFSARFREAASRALLLPRRDPGRRTPLWQQRQRSAQLLDVARKYPTFPIILETVRECLQDVYDLPALLDTLRRIEGRSIKISEVETETPSPFARTLLFGYVAQFLYEGDSPLAERRAAALSLDPALLSELLGKDELRELLDPAVIRQTEARLQHTAPGYRFKGVEGAADLLRLLGPLSAPELARRLRATGSASASVSASASSANIDAPEQQMLTGDQAETGEHVLTATAAQELLEELLASRRALKFTLHGREHYAAIEDAARLRDGLGVPLPMGVPLAFLEPAPEPLADLVGRYARTHAPFTATQAAQALGLGSAVVEASLQALATQRRVISGEFLPEEVRAELSLARTGALEPPGTEWVDAGVLRTLRARSLAALRQDVEPVSGAIYGKFLPPWQHVGTWELQEETHAPGTFGAPAHGVSASAHFDDSPMLTGYDGLLTVIDQISGVRIPASALESLVLRSRISDYSPALLDRAMSSGDVLWSGDGDLGGDGWICLHLSEAAALTLPLAREREQTLAGLGPLEHALYEILGSGGLFFPQIKEALTRYGQSALESIGHTGSPDLTSTDISTALWNLAWAGLITNDTFAPVRALLAGGKAAHKLKKPTPAPRSAARRGAARLTGSRLSAQQRFAPTAYDSTAPKDAGRWSRIHTQELDPTIAAAAHAELLMDRYGVLTRGAVATENTPGGFSTIYRILATAEEKGLARRGYFIEELGAAQFSTANTIDTLRAYTREQENTAGRSQSRRTAVLLAATDPANPYGGTLPWPAVADFLPGEPNTRHKPGRKAGASLVLVDGEPVLYLERGGRTALAFTSDVKTLAAATPLLSELVRRGAAAQLMIEKINDVGILENPAGLVEDTPHPITVIREQLLANGFYSTPKGVRMRKEY